MAKKSTKHRLPSGSVRIQAYDYTDDAGKKHYRSFTAPTLAEAKTMRSEWQLHRKDEQEVASNLTIQSAARRYIDSKDGEHDLLDTNPFIKPVLPDHLGKLKSMI